MARQNKEPVQKTGVESITNQIEGNTDMAKEKTYVATKGISHSGKQYVKGDVVSNISEKDLERLIRLGAVSEKNDGFPRLD